MIFIIVAVILTALYTFLFNLIGLSLWFNFLWVVLSLILAILTILGILEIMFIFMKKTAPTGKFRHYLLHQATGLILLFSGIKVEIIGKENIPNDTFVCYANHKSNFDIVILYHHLHRIASAVGKKSLFEVPVINQLAGVFGAVSLDRDNDREAAKSIIYATKLIKSGLSMIIFPEGGIKSRDTEEMVNLRAGAYKLVTKTGVNLLPVTILGSSNIKNKAKKKVKIIIHKPYTQEDYQNLNTIEIGTMVQELINGDIHNNEE